MSGAPGGAVGPEAFGPEHPEDGAAQAGLWSTVLVRLLWGGLRRLAWRFAWGGARVRPEPLALQRLWDDPAAPGYACAWAAFQETSGLIPADPSGGDLHRLRLVDATIWGLGACERLLFARCGSAPSPNLSGVQADLMRRLHPAASPRRA